MLNCTILARLTLIAAALAGGALGHHGGRLCVKSDGRVELQSRYSPCCTDADQIDECSDDRPALAYQLNRDCPTCRSCTWISNSLTPSRPPGPSHTNTLLAAIPLAPAASILIAPSAAPILLTIASPPSAFPSLLTSIVLLC